PAERAGTDRRPRPAGGRGRTPPGRARPRPAGPAPPASREGAGAERTTLQRRAVRPRRAATRSLRGSGWRPSLHLPLGRTGGQAPSGRQAPSALAVAAFVQKPVAGGRVLCESG